MKMLSCGFPYVRCIPDPKVLSPLHIKLYCTWHSVAPSEHIRKLSGLKFRVFQELRLTEVLGGERTLQQQPAVVQCLHSSHHSLLCVLCKIEARSRAAHSEHFHFKFQYLLVNRYLNWQVCLKYYCAKIHK